MFGSRSAVRGFRGRRRRGGRPESDRLSSFTRALVFQRETLAQIADQVREIPEGWVMRSRSLPQVWAVNQVRITQPIGFQRAVAVADRHLADLPYRQLLVEPQASGKRLERDFRSAGWRVECEVTMALMRPPDREVDTGGVIHPPADEVIELLHRWTVEDGGTSDPEAHRQLSRHWELEWRARNARFLGIRGSFGELAAIAVLYSDGAIAQIEDVYTVPEARGRGFARTLVTEALRLARVGEHDLTFIVADDNGWPKQLYSRLGFDPVGHVWIFHR